MSVATTAQTEPTTPAALGPFLKMKAAAEFLGVDRATLRREIDDGQIPVVMIRGSQRVQLSDLQQYIEDRRGYKAR